MTSTNLTLARFGTKHVALLIASSALLTAGCSNMESTATGGSPFSGAAVMNGKVHGGNNPVAGAGVMLYIVGQSGVGSAPTLLAQTTTASDGTGSFRFTKNSGNTSSLPTNPGSSYQCPTGTDPLLYIFAAGGNTTGNPGTVANNTAAAFLAPVGYCSQVSNATYVDVSEVTTVATVAAAAQFINPNNDGIGNDGIGVAYQAIGNAFKTIPNLVNQATGVANTTTTVAGSGVGVSGVTMTVTAPATTVNTIANILTACVNTTIQSSTNCSTLFANAVPPSNAARESQPTVSYNTASDTIQAALYMFLNPTDGSATHRSNLFNLAPAGGAPFQPTLSAAPMDWLLPLTYSTTNTCGTGGSSYFSHPYDLNIDVNGNLWIANNAGSNAALVEMSPAGLAETCVTEAGSSLGGGVVDVNGSIWTADNADSIIYSYVPATNSIRTFSTAAPPVAITADGNGNIFFTTLSGGTSSIYEITDGANTNNTSSPIQILSQSSTLGPNPIRMFPDGAGDVWISSGAGYITEMQLTTNTGNLHGFLPNQFPAPSPTYGLIVGPLNKVYVTSQDTSATFTQFTPSGNSYNTAVIASGNAGGLATPTGIWLDGSQSSWIANNAAETSGLYAVSQIGPDGASLSPTGTNGGYQKPLTALNAGRTSVVDPAGSVWILNDNAPNTITQLLGAAVPIYAPYSLGLQNGRFQTIP